MTSAHHHCSFTPSPSAHTLHILLSPAAPPLSLTPPLPVGLLKRRHRWLWHPPSLTCTLHTHMQMSAHSIHHHTIMLLSHLSIHLPLLSIYLSFGCSPPVKKVSHRTSSERRYRSLSIIKALVNHQIVDIRYTLHESNESKVRNKEVKAHNQ